MCGIFGYVGNRTDAATLVLDGLKRLDYRGYDSWGVAVLADKTISIEKDAGKISDIKNLKDLPASSMAIAHTRWATTGATTQVNAHPHYSTDHSFALAQNGIVENYLELKKDLQAKGYAFISETDTEVIVRLIEEKRKTSKTLKAAVRAAFQDLAGRNTIIVISTDNEIIAARNGSPLVIGVNPETKEIFLSSDTLSFAQLASKMVFVENGQMVYIQDEIKISDIATNKAVTYELADVGITQIRVDKEGYDHFMLKEIHEAPFAINQVIEQEIEQYAHLAQAVQKARNIYTIGSGGAGVAAAQVAFYLRDIGNIHAVSLVGSDAVEYQHLLQKGDLIITISQSGETADVLEVLELAKKNGVEIASFVNMPGSMITRMSDYQFMAESGPEICVMSTKTFTAQITFGYLLAKTVAGEGSDARKELKKLAKQIDTYLLNAENHNQIKKVAKILCQKHDVFLLAKYQNFQIIREGMMKIIEASYKHGHALPAGDLKHYVITLMEEGVAVLAVLSNDKTATDVISAINEVRLRGAEVFAISPKAYDNVDHHLLVPDTGQTSAIMNLIPLQLLSYYMAVELENNVDKPRNIAKSVTVK